jgi:hypothetical protein
MGKNKDKTQRVIVAVSALAFDCPSAFTIVWSKEEHKEEMLTFFAGITTTAATIARGSESAPSVLRTLKERPKMINPFTVNIC